jgi:sulfate adenylyltransferase
MMLAQRLRGRTARHVEVLDGDKLRPSLGPDLGFTREDRIRFVERVAELAYETTSQGGIALCALVAPYDVARKRVRARIAEVGAFVLVYVATPLAVCEQRDDKGLYARARRRKMPTFTGISDPYEPPHDAELTVDTSITSAEEVASAALVLLEQLGLINPEAC